MKLTLSSLVLFTLSLMCTSCSTEEKDGRKYYGASTPVQSRMGVQYKRLRSDTTDAPRTADGSLFGRSGDPDSPGLLDRNRKPEEPGVIYTVSGRQSANPVQSRMGVQITHRKK
ncbi:hypothetical protein EI77_00362 [Prosthecobacter fusiformis]|uniref:Uncharacterized protein n=1 Tax=Prosthecobacter fusiformis TaxID=48464 RepID=A0A4R7SPD8_9BACT|nr:hypothetical protein [Prosthecobacter fusiformis]TDU81060.1 hypothetical protein EI77_00362 [Prosthecobacter fusiformis]